VAPVHHADTRQHPALPRPHPRLSCNRWISIFAFDCWTAPKS
jgi:hypothetical protein